MYKCIFAVYKCINTVYVLNYTPLERINNDAETEKAVLGAYMCVISNTNYNRIQITNLYLNTNLYMNSIASCLAGTNWANTQNGVPRTPKKCLRAALKSLLGSKLNIF